MASSDSNGRQNRQRGWAGMRVPGVVSEAEKNWQHGSSKELCFFHSTIVLTTSIVHLPPAFRNILLHTNQEEERKQYYF